jgi:hypothetical protein
MNSSVQFLALGVTGLLLAGCSGGDEPEPFRTAVVAPQTSAVPAAEFGQSLADLDRALADLDTQLTDADHDVATPEGDIR